MRKNAAATLMASWMQTGSFDVKIKKTELSGDESEVRVTCIVCSGDLCEKQELRLFPPPRDLCLTARLLIQLLAQPLAIASASCFMLLAASCIFPSVFTDAVLSLVGGRSNGWLVLAAANAAHVFESAVAFAVMIRLAAGARAAVGWSLLTFFLGFPACGFVSAYDATMRHKELNSPYTKRFAPPSASRVASFSRNFPNIKLLCV